MTSLLGTTALRCGLVTVSVSASSNELFLDLRRWSSSIFSCPKVLENHLENEWDRQDQLRWFSRDDPPPLQQPELLKWRHWRPGKIREMEPTTQRALELHMCGKWAERLLAHFAPFAEHIAYMQDILGEDFRKEALDLLGDSRFRTLRQHCLVYESLRKRGFTGRNDMSVLLPSAAAMRRGQRLGKPARRRRHQAVEVVRRYHLVRLVHRNARE